MSERDVVLAHKRSSLHRAEVLASAQCGCFHCCAVLSPSAITEWTDQGQTALCPECGIDSVIGDLSGFSVAPDFLAEMRAYWFERPVAPAAAGPHVYDKAKHHTDSIEDEYGFDPDKAAEQAPVPTAFFFGWLASRGLLSSGQAKWARREIAAYQERRMTAPDLWGLFDHCLIDYMLSDEGNAFTRFYFQFEDEPSYFDDLAVTLAAELPSCFHVPYTFENQARIDAVIDQRHAQWRARALQDGTLHLPPAPRPTRNVRANPVEDGVRRVAVGKACAWTAAVCALTVFPLGSSQSNLAYLAWRLVGIALFLPLVYLLARVFKAPGNESCKAACAQAAGLLVLGMLVSTVSAFSLLGAGHRAPEIGDGKFFLLSLALLAAGVWRAPKGAVVAF